MGMEWDVYAFYESHQLLSVCILIKDYVLLTQSNCVGLSVI